MYKILKKETLSDVIKLMEVQAPHVARKATAGQFIIVRIDEQGERIPLTIADYNREAGTITIIFQELGKSTMQLGRMEPGEALSTFVGPLGHPTEIENYGSVVCMGGGVGIAPIYPIARSLREAGNTVISIIGARNKDLLFWRDELSSVSDQLIVMTDDGTFGRKGLVTEPLKDLLSTEKIDRVIAIGPSIMMKFSSLTSKPFGVKTIVSMNPIMVDGTGMCGCCRLSVNGQTKFACVDGPDFDGHQVDWDLLMARQRTYLDEEKISFDQWLRTHTAQTKAVK